MFSSILSGQNPLNKGEAICQLLAPFGLDQQETFPLPPCIKKGAWAAIWQFQQTTLPDLMIKHIPEWRTLKKSKDHQGKLNAWLNDSSLTDTFSALAGPLMDQGFDELSKIHLSIGQKLNGLLPPFVLSQDQQEALDEQWDVLLEAENSVQILKEFGKQCLEALALQLCKDLYKNYRGPCALESNDEVDSEDEK